MSTAAIQPGRTMTFIAPAAGVTNGAAALVQNMVVVPNSTATVGVAFEGNTEGVHLLAKASGAAWTTGQVLYFDTANNNFVTAASATARRAGFAAAPALSGDTTGAVKLNNVGAAVNVA